MRAFKVKTNVDVINRQKVDGGVKNQGANDILAWKNPIQVGSYTPSPSESERSKQEFQLHNTTETLLASDAPELVVFIQESDYQSVKDIFIDREDPSRSGLSYMNDDHHEEPEKTLGIMSSISNEIEQDFQNYVRKQHALENLMKKSEEEYSDGRDDHLLDKPVKKMMPEKQLVKEVHIEDDASLNPLESSASESIEDSSHLSEASSNSEAESGSTIRHLSDSSLTTMSSLEEFLEGPEYQQPPKTDNLFRTEDTMSRSVTGPSLSFINQLGSFAVSPLSVSGPIPCSGNISLHSTSSNASSKSFAFPM
ncbi:hypothetical protein CCACVL1_00043 [Corchorus capsularis]|uniref:Uncharacterized protein n=1 Tax=Corchorus capsularis TaxID=210143 RepID=A0A1R3KZ75_COCAP|nr:hypothetical protein CCACVL1_00043 [Corchorus capsularis]